MTPNPLTATYEGQTVVYDGRSITACHETVDALHRQAEALAPRFAEWTADSGCTNYGDLKGAGPRQLRAYALIAQAHAWNEIAGILEEARDTQRAEAAADATTFSIPPEGSVVEWHEDFSSIRTGIVSNVPQVRCIGRLSHIRNDGVFAVVFTPDQVRRIVHVAALTVIAPKAEAGWGAL